MLADEETMSSDRTGRDSDELSTITDDAWTAPSSGAVVYLWVVLRDSRGGLAFTSDDIIVK